MTVYLDPIDYAANQIPKTAGGVRPDDFNVNIIDAIRALKDLLEGIEAHGMDYLFKPGATWDFEVQLGDAAGARKVIVRDSGGVEVAAIDSDGNITLSGIIDGVDLAAHVVDADAHHAAITLGGGSDAALALAGQQLTLADVLTPAEHTAIGNGAPHHAQAHDAADHTNRTRRIILDVAAGQRVGGTGVASEWLGLRRSLPDAEVCTYEWSVPTPSDLVGSTLLVVWLWESPPAAGNARFHIAIQQKGNGETASWNLLDDTSDYATAGANIFNLDTIVTTLPAEQAAEYIGVMIERVANHANDTLNDVAYLRGVWIEYTADS